MSYTPEHPQIRLTGDLALALYALAALTARTAGRKLRGRKPSRGATLTPGINTPLWNELVDQALPHLAKRGSKAHLARILGLSRQRLQVCLKSRTACLDAERTLLLMCWVTARQQGGNLEV